VRDGEQGHPLFEPFESFSVAGNMKGYRPRCCQFVTNF